MQFWGCKLIAVKSKNHISPALLLAGKLLLCSTPVFLPGCAAQKPAVYTLPGTPISPPAPGIANTATEIQRIAPEVYRQIRSEYADIFGPDRLIINVLEPVKNLRSLFKASTVSFTLANMPEDMARILQKYPAGEEYGTFYDFLVANIDRIVLCPDIYYYGISSGSIMYGIAYPALDILLYPEEASVYLNTFYGKSGWNSIITLISEVIHETKHQEINRLFMNGKISTDLFYSTVHQERDAYIMQEKFLKFFAQDTEYALYREDIARYLRRVTTEIERYNSILGLPRGDRTLLLLSLK
jgi:hypothetical protein